MRGNVAVAVFGAGLALAIAGAAPSNTFAQTPERWQQAMPEAEDRKRGAEISHAIRTRSWLEGAQKADLWDGGHAVSHYSAYLYQMVGRSDLVGALERRGKLSERPPCPPATDLRPALKTVLARVGDHRVVILNDSHDHAHSRVLLHLLLEPLRSLGFTHLSVEDFDPDPEAYAKLAYPGQAKAWQSSREPVFADAIRHAIKIGYRLFPHEVDWEQLLALPEKKQLQFREDAQARNLIDHVLSADPDSRILVYAGHQHAFEAIVEKISPTYKPMALRLKELAGIDPLTVDQTGCWTGEPASVPGPIAFDKDGNSIAAGMAEGRVDLQIRQPKPADRDRADWLRRLGRVPVAVPEGLRDGLAPVVVEARLANEPENAVPLD
ncbi:MAG: hypothetical protein ACOC91_02880, partial [bacterium]